MGETQRRLGGRRWLVPTGAAAVLTAVTFTLSAAGVNPAAAGQLFLITVLLHATRGGLGIGVTAALVATAAFNVFFLPPTGTFDIADASTWVALASFLAAAVLASRLVVRARRQAQTALARATEIEALYRLGIELFTAAVGTRSLAHTATEAVRATGAAAGGLALFRGGGELAFPDWFGEVPDGTVRQRIASLRVHGQTLEFPATRGTDLYLPLLTGEEPVGALVARATEATRSALESAARLLALALERDRLLADRSRLEALRESEALKTALLRAVSHDLSSPLTVMGIQVDGLRRELGPYPELGSRLAALTTQIGLLQRRIGNLLSFARLEAGQIEPHPEPLPVPDLVRAARESLSLPRPERPVAVEIAPDCPDLLVDPSLALEILVNLLENADRASPPGEALEIRGGRHPTLPARIRLGVLDRGPGLTELGEEGQEIDAANVQPRGLGLEIARSFAGASGGAIRLTRRHGGGTCAWADLPAAASGEP